MSDEILDEQTPDNIIGSIIRERGVEISNELFDKLNSAENKHHVLQTIFRHYNNGSSDTVMYFPDEAVNLLQALTRARIISRGEKNTRDGPYTYSKIYVEGGSIVADEIIEYQYTSNGSYLEFVQDSNEA
ncbi:MAG: hypothetical protein Q9M91_08740 [Candidatus Dojkabacteria bacterium]|nr:hypothetical protein [Candidatus Dojkabacteria bacterium]MDQ7021859.1 hypothetical protein [Candidatus Dojkabacteria bacterium]